MVKITEEIRESLAGTKTVFLATASKASSKTMQENGTAVGPKIFCTA